MVWGVLRLYNKMLQLLDRAVGSTFCAARMQSGKYVQEITLETAHHPLLFKDVVLHMKLGYKQEKPPHSSCYQNKQYKRNFSKLSVDKYLIPKSSLRT